MTFQQITRYRCPKCKAESGDDWSQCHKKCPVKMSPHFDEATFRRFPKRSQDGLEYVNTTEIEP